MSIVTGGNIGMSMMAIGGTIMASSFMPSGINPMNAGLPSTGVLAIGAGITAVGGALSIISRD